MLTNCDWKEIIVKPYCKFKANNYTSATKKYIYSNYYNLFKTCLILYN